MAVSDQQQTPSAAWRRSLFGANVAILIGLVLFIVIGINLLVQHWLDRKIDLTGGFVSYRLSERTKTAIDKLDQDVRITTVYASDAPETARKEYFPKLRDLCDELRRYDRRITVEHLHTGNQVAEMRKRMRGQLTKAAGEYDDAIKLARQTWRELPEEIADLRQAIKATQASENSWVGHFTMLTRFSDDFDKLLEEMTDAQREIEDLIEGEAIPRYQEANDRIEELNNQVKGNVEATQKWLTGISKLADVLGDPEGEFVKETRNQLVEGGLRLEKLRMAAGSPDDAVPEDPAPALEKMAEAAQALAVWLVDETARLNAFTKEHPVIQDNPLWAPVVERPSGIAGIMVQQRMTLGSILADGTSALSDTVLRVKLELQGSTPKEELTETLKQFRDLTAAVAAQQEYYRNNINTLFAQAQAVDEGSQALLTFVSEAGGFKTVLDKLQAVADAIAELPELELDDLAARLEEDNLVIVETPDDVKVISFDEVWPIAGVRPSQPNADDDDRHRVFDGDSAISSLLMSMTYDKKFATVIFVGFEPELPPQLQQMMQREANTGPIPFSMMETIKSKLEKANFAVKEWNIGSEDAASARPEPVEGTEVVYIILPPAPPLPPQLMQMMMQRQMPPPRSFSQADVTMIEEALADAAGAVFLNTFGQDLPGMTSYTDYLRNTWGIDVDSQYRVVAGVPDKRDQGVYEMNLEQMISMQLSNFSDHPVGRPLKARRMLWTDVCPVVENKLAEPEGVTVYPILSVPSGNREIWAENREGFDRLRTIIQTGKGGGRFSKDEDTAMDPPFTVIMAAEKARERAEEPATTQPGEASPTTQPAEPDKTRIVVMGTGVSYVDPVLNRPVPRFSGEGKRAAFSTDPPPTECVDLMLNSLYWFTGREDLIASGPVETPLIPQIETKTRQGVFVAAMAWAAIVLAVGGVVMFVRRK